MHRFDRTRDFARFNDLFVYMLADVRRATSQVTVCLPVTAAVHFPAALSRRPTSGRWSGLQAHIASMRGPVN